jgi:hypothetical protein
MGGARLPGRERSRGRGAQADGWGRADSGRATREGEGRQLTGGGGMSVAARARSDGPLGPRRGAE